MLAALLPSSPANAADCSERTKFVRDTSAGSSGTYGARASLHDIGQIPAPGCQNAFTVHMHMGPSSVNDFVEVGYRYKDSDGNYPRFFVEADIYPAYSGEANLYLYVSGTVADLPVRYFNVTPDVGYSYRYKAQYSNDDANWTTLQTLPASFAYNYGVNMSEAAVFGYAGSPIYEFYNLRFRPSTAGWMPWGHLGCSTYATPAYNYNNTVLNHYAKKTSETSWESQTGIPAPGAC